MSSLALMGAGPESSAAPAFNPGSVAGLLFDWDFSTLGLSDGAAIASRTDGSGNGNTLAQATGSLQPIFKTAIQNGLGVARFDGTDDVMVATNAVTPRHVFMVAKNAAATFTISNRGLLSGTGAGGTELMAIGIGGGTTFADPAAGGLTFVSYFKDGTSFISSNEQGPMNVFACMDLAVSDWPLLTPQVGKDRTLVAPWLGDIGRIIGYNAVLSTPNRQYVQAGLKAQWGTP